MMRRVALALIAMALLIGAVWAYFQSGASRSANNSHNDIVSRALSSRKAALERVTFYRVKSSYTVRETGEWIDFDYVVSCAVIETTYKDGSSSIDTFGVNPKTFIKPTRDDHAILMQSPRACNGETLPEDVPPDLLPFAVFFEDVNDMTFGWGYASMDENPKARMDFQGAKLLPATYADWKAWRAEAEANFKPFGPVRSPWGWSGEEGGQAVKIAWSCDAYTGYPLREQDRAAIRVEWEERGRPEFWYPNWERLPRWWGQDAVRNYYFVKDSRGRGDGFSELGSYVFVKHRPWMKDLKPHFTDFYPLEEATIKDGNITPQRLLFKPEWKGFIACKLRNDTQEILRLHNFEKRKIDFYINDYLIPGSNVFIPPGGLAMKDEYVFTYFGHSIVDTF